MTVTAGIEANPFTTAEAPKQVRPKRAKAEAVDFSQYSAKTVEKRHGGKVYQWTMMPEGIAKVDEAFSALEDRRALLRAEHEAAVKELEKKLAESMALLETETGVTAALGAALHSRPIEVPPASAKKATGVTQAEYRRLNEDVRSVNREHGRAVTERGRNSNENIEFWEQVRGRPFPRQ